MCDRAVLLLVGVVLVLLVRVPHITSLSVAVTTARSKSYGGGVTCGFKGQIEQNCFFFNLKK